MEILAALRRGQLLLVLAVVGVSVASASSITTVFGANNSGGSNNPLMFNIQVLNLLGITITGADVNSRIGGVVGTTFVLNVYTTPTTYVGQEQNPGAWTLRGTGTGTSAVENSPSNVPLSNFFLAQGTYGIAFNSPTLNQGYTTGANVYSNADVMLTLGASAGGGFFTGIPFSPRTWNGTIYYTVGSSVPEPSTTALFGAGVAGLFLLAARVRARRKSTPIS